MSKLKFYFGILICGVLILNSCSDGFPPPEEEIPLTEVTIRLKIQDNLISGGYPVDRLVGSVFDELGGKNKDDDFDGDLFFKCDNFTYWDHNNTGRSHNMFVKLEEVGGPWQFQFFADEPCSFGNGSDMVVEVPEGKSIEYTTYLYELCEEVNQISPVGFGQFFWQLSKRTIHPTEYESGTVIIEIDDFTVPRCSI